MGTIRISRDRSIPEARSAGQILQSFRLQRTNQAEDPSRIAYNRDYIARANIVDAPGVMDDLTWTGKTALAVIDAGQTVVFGTLLVRASDGELEVLDATKAASTGEVFMALGADVGEQLVLCSGGTLRNASWSWTAGKRVWLDTATPGGLTQTSPMTTEFVAHFCVGHAVSSDTIYFERASSPTTSTQDELFFSVLTAAYHFHKLVVHGSYLYAITGTGDKIYRTSDGDTWTDVSFTGMTAHTVNDAISDGTYLYLAGSFTISGSSKKGIVRSSDGVAYTQVLDISGGYDCTAIYKGGTYYFAGTDTGGGAGNARVYQSSDGNTWTNVYSGSANVLRFNCFLEYGSPTYLYAGVEYTSNNARLIYSTTNGSSWNMTGGLSFSDSDGTAIMWVVSDGSRWLCGGQYCGIWSYELDPATATIGWVQVYTGAASAAVFRTMSGTKRLYHGHYPCVHYTLDHWRHIAVDGPSGKLHCVSLCEFGGHLYMASIQSGQYKVWRLSKSLTLTMT